VGTPVAPERRVADDLVRKAILVAPALVLVVGLVRGVDGAVGAAIALVLVAANFTASSALISWFSRLGVGALAGAVMLGYALRLLVLFVAVVLLRELAWVDVPALVVVLAGTHLGLLFWETRSVSLTAAFPGLRPERE